MSTVLYETIVPKGTSASQALARGAAKYQQRGKTGSNLADVINAATKSMHGRAVAYDLKKRLQALESTVEKRATNGQGALIVVTYERSKHRDPHLATRRILSAYVAATGKDKQATLSKWSSSDRLSKGANRGYVMDGSEYYWATRSVWPTSPYAPAVADRGKYVATTIVKRGDTLGALCKQFYPDATGRKLWQRVDQVAKENNIANPNLIRVGQKINFPK